MKQWIPLEKRSKKDQKQYHAARRGTWLGVNPVTRTVRSKKAYDRKKAKQADRRFGCRPQD